ncbi:FecR family protein [Parabacteroides timonensis]|uniref:FecR family protein n=1 Tax=Parabacteroides timonensis TaxID=1871013 RepID=UPI00094E5072|nr:FecR domain-containing protein [Parabacteroides timonensis]
MDTPDKRKIDNTLNNTATQEEAKEVIRWFSTPEGGTFLSKLMDNDLKNIPLRQESDYIEHPIPSSEMYEFIINRIRRQQRGRILFKVAAILIPILLLTGQFWYIDKKVDLFDNAGYEEIVVPKGERMQLVFQDGSKASLNSESRIKYPRKFSFTERKVELEGEAFFEISSNKERPFIVDLNSINVQVLGTTFNVKAYSSDSDILITLETGKISISNKIQSIAFLKPGEKATYNKITQKCLITKSKDITQASAWKKNLIIFDNTPLSEVIATLSRWYNINFIINDPSTLKYSYTLTSHKKQVQEILSELEKIAPVRFTEQKNSSYSVSLKK